MFIKSSMTVTVLAGLMLAGCTADPFATNPHGNMQTGATAGALLGGVAGAVGQPKAVRAVGTAVGRNPISWLIPCHRALRKTGELGGYHWGLPVKRALLAWEAARTEDAA